MLYSRKILFLGAMSALKIINKVRKSKYYRTDLKKNEDLNSKDRNIQSALICASGKTKS